LGQDCWFFRFHFIFVLHHTSRFWLHNLQNGEQIANVLVQKFLLSGIKRVSAFIALVKHEVSTNMIILTFRFGFNKYSGLAAIVGMDTNISAIWVQPICYLQFNNSIIIQKTGSIIPITHKKTSQCRLFQYRIACAPLDLSDIQIDAVKSQSDSFKFSLQIFDQEPVQVCL
jgi:hypothetical protein